MSGKTDILVRYENQNLFIAECKFWSGKAGFSETVDQLFRYRAWRDTKLAIVMFVRERDLTTIVEKAHESPGGAPAVHRVAGRRDRDGAPLRDELARRRSAPGRPQRLLRPPARARSSALRPEKGKSSGVDAVNACDPARQPEAARPVSSRRPRRTCAQGGRQAANRRCTRAQGGDAAMRCDLQRFLAVFCQRSLARVAEGGERETRPMTVERRQIQSVGFRADDRATPTGYQCTRARFGRAGCRERLRLWVRRVEEASGCRGASNRRIGPPVSGARSSSTLATSTSRWATKRERSRGSWNCGSALAHSLRVSRVLPPKICISWPITRRRRRFRCLPEHRSCPSRDDPPGAARRHVLDRGADPNQKRACRWRGGARAALHLPHQRRA